MKTPPKTTTVTSVTVRMYNVGFGDCFLVTLHNSVGADVTMLFDCGRHSGTLLDAPDFWAVVQQVIKDLPKRNDKPFVDVIVMTHRHRDHVHGFSKPALWEEVTAGQVWMPWTENDKDPVANGLRKQQDTTARNALRALRALGTSPSSGAYGLALNSITNESAMTTLRRLGGPNIRYLPDPLTPASTVLTNGMPSGVTVHVLGPSRDPKVIRTLDPPNGQAYLRLAVDEDSQKELDEPDGPVLTSTPTIPAPWGGRYDRPAAEVYERLRAPAPAAKLDDKLLDYVRTSSRTDGENLAFSVDQALNGTSLVLLLEVGPLVLLFPGDAQWGTWSEILAAPAWQEKLHNTKFLKVGHHGSHNATPVDFVEKGYLKNATAMVSVSDTAYDTEGWKAIPKKELLAALTSKKRVTNLIRSDTLGPTELFTEVTLAVGP